MSSNNEFYSKATTKQEFKEIRKNAQHQYRFLKQAMPLKGHADYATMMGQITLYAGIANWDKALWEKGINKFFKATEKRQSEMKDITGMSDMCRFENVHRDKTKAKDEQEETATVFMSEAENLHKIYDAFVEKKRIYYKEQMPIMYEEYWEGMKKIQENKKNRSAKKN